MDFKFDEAKGHYITKHHLASFGGAGGQLACAIAEDLGIEDFNLQILFYPLCLWDWIEEQRVCAKSI